MSKLDELIQQYCPDGVEYLKIGNPNVAKVSNGFAFASNLLSSSGNYGVCKTTNIQNGRISEDKMQYVDDKPSELYVIKPQTIVLGLSGTIKAGINDTNKTYYLNQRVAKFESKSKIDNKYLYYVIMQIAPKYADMLNSGSVKNLSTKMVEGTEIPVPPLPVQEEIVRILDKFTELEQELEQELELRKKQYEYYRDKMLSLSDYDGEVEWKPLGVVCNIVRGASPRPIKKYVTDDKINGVHWIKIGDASPESKYIDDTNEYITQEGAKHSRFVKKGSFILSNSMSFGRPYILNIDGCIHDGWLSLSDFESDVLPDYLYHVLMSGNLQLEMRRKAGDGGCVSNLNSDIVKNIKIPIIDKTQQRKIVCLLDRFNKLTSDISEGLPAEIKMRHQQYEYYRDKLLTFKRNEVVD